MRLQAVQQGLVTIWRSAANSHYHVVMDILSPETLSKCVQQPGSQALGMCEQAVGQLREKSAPDALICFPLA